MKHLAILGKGPRLMVIAEHLHGADFLVTWLPTPHEPPNGGERHSPGGIFPAPGVALALASRADQLRTLASVAEAYSLAWLCLCDGAQDDGGAELTTAAYRSGALAVLPPESPLELVEQAVERALESLTAQSRPEGHRPRRRHYRAGEAITIGVEEMLRIETGIIAQVAWYEDGGEGLVGLWGAGHLLSGHPKDACGLSLRAHTATVIEVDRLAPSADTFDRLLERICRLEAWSSVQSRQNMQQRLLGILALLAEQFGTACAEGTLIDVRITHAQLACAIGASRATVTRLLGPLRRRGHVLTVPSAEGERFCLPRLRSGESLEAAASLSVVARR